MDEKIGPATGKPMSPIELTNINRETEYNNLDGPPVDVPMSEIGEFVFDLIPTFSGKLPKLFCVKVQYSDHAVSYDFAVKGGKVILASIGFEGPIGRTPTKILE